VTAPVPTPSPPLTDAEAQADLTRSVYCVLGIPVDAIGLAAVVRRIEAAAANRTAFLISTPNLNFLVSSLSDEEFRESLLDSDLCPPDGAPIVLIARLIGLPIKERAAGSDLLDWLRNTNKRTLRLKVFLFGGAKGVAAAAANALNSEPDGLRCVGTMDPGFGSVSEMSRDHIIDTVNSSNADLLAVALGAKKGQQWLQRNHKRLTIPVRAHLGAAINFQAGTVKRAPPKVRAWGLEWLWRIKEEPYLWRRYCYDGIVLARILMTRVLPLAIANRWHRFKSTLETQDLLITLGHSDRSIMIDVSGFATEETAQKAASYFGEALTGKQNVIVDLSRTRFIDARFFGLLLVFRKHLKAQGAKLIFTGLSPAILRIFRLNELGFLTSEDPSA
jgi:N-acetylglucosaminyldiphosphoundecaprenol N-acetyl-beta-D-mannosaminyltransferase